MMSGPNYPIFVRLLSLSVVCVSLTKAQISPIMATQRALTTDFPSITSIGPTICTLPDQSPGFVCVENDGVCISANKRCDNYEDCPSGEDERGCKVDSSCLETQTDLDSILEKCSLREDFVSGFREHVESDTWVFFQNASVSYGYVSQVTLDRNFLAAGLYRVNLSMPSNSILFQIDGKDPSSDVQTKVVRTPEFFAVNNYRITLERYSPEQGAFGFQLALGQIAVTVVSGNCSYASVDCLISIWNSSQHRCYLPSEAQAYVSTLGQCPVLPDCGEEEFLCRSIPACIPSSQLCTSRYNCGDRSVLACDDIENCVESPAYFACLTEEVVRDKDVFTAIGEGPVVVRDYPAGKTVFLSELEFDTLYNDDSSTYRFNVTVNSETVVVYRVLGYEEEFTDELSFSIRLPSPLKVVAGDRLVVTWEITQGNPLLFPWQLHNISRVTVKAAEFIGTCNSSLQCIGSLAESGSFLDICPHSDLFSFIQTELDSCFGPPEISFISESVTVPMGSSYTVVCTASAPGHPGPSVRLLAGGEELPAETSLNFNKRSVFYSFHDITEEILVTCQAAVQRKIAERVVKISLMSSACNERLEVAQSFLGRNCLSIEQRIGNSQSQYFQTAEVRIFSGGSLVNASIRSEYFGIGLVDFLVEVRVEQFFSQPSKRSLGNLMYSRIHRNVLVKFSENVVIRFEPPVRVESDDTVLIRVSALSLSEYETSPSPMVIVGVLAGCTEEELDCSLDEWGEVINDACFRDVYVPDLEESTYFLRVVETCSGITQAEPRITVDPESLIERRIEETFHTQCNAEHTTGIEWFKMSWYGDVPINVSGTVLSFEGFEPMDQGVYYCVAYGGSNYPEAVATSKPVTVLLQDMETFIVTVRFLYRNLTKVLRDPESQEHFEIANDIRPYFQLLHDIGLEDFSIQELRPGSVEADVLLHVPSEVGIDEIEDFLKMEGKLFEVPPEIIDFLQPDSSSVSLVSVSFCEATTFNSTAAGPLTFPRASVGSVVESKQFCPSYSPMEGSARALARCQGDLVSASFWADPELNSCFEGMETDQGLEEFTMFVQSNPVTVDNVTEVSRDVADATNMAALDSQDLVNVAIILEDVVNVGSPSPEVTSNVVEAIDNVLDLKQNAYDDSIPEKAPTRILVSLETQLTNLHDGGEEVNFTDVRANVGAVARSLDRTEFAAPITFGNFFTGTNDDIQENLNESETVIFRGRNRIVVNDVKAAITLPGSLLVGTIYENSDVVPVTFIIHRTSHLFMSSASQNMEEEMEKEVGSLIISATIEGEMITNLESPVVSQFHLLRSDADAGVDNPRCVFWDFSLSNGLGGWSSDGCAVSMIVEDSRASVVECECDHLTNFAVLVDVQGDIDSIVLDILSIIGCVVSIIALIITIITYLLVKKYRSQRPKQILIHLCFALLGLYLSFLIGIGRSNLQLGCAIFGGLIHFFCLASVAWMCVEAVNMYLLFVKIFDSGISGFMWKATLAAWGCPLVIVVVSVVLRSDHYRGDYCFPQAGTLTLYISVMAFLGLMILGNAICFVLVIRQLTCGRSTIAKDQDRRQDVIRYLAISVLLGLTWAFGFLAIGGAQFIFNLLFLIFNSLQGFFIFFFFCLRQEEVREIWCQWLRHPCTSGDYKQGKQTNPSTENRSSTDTKSNKKTNSTAANSESIQMVAGGENGNTEHT